MHAVIDSIQRDVEQLLAHPTYQQWAATQALREGDICLVNNSFVYRDVTTTKSDRYLAIMFAGSGQPEPNPFIATGVRINSDLKRIAARSSNFPVLTTMEDAVQTQIADIGVLAFVLIGRVEDTVIIEQALDHPTFDQVIWDPSLPSVARVNESTITVQDTYDEDAVWSVVAAWLVEQGRPISDDLREAIGIALDRLQDRAIAKLILPGVTDAGQQSMTDDIVRVLKEQREHYARALSHVARQPSEPQTALNDVLRIAYNFASDASTFLRLIVSVCDLKPIVLWGTIAEHFKLSESFRHLPWTRSLSKPSLKNYIATISDARNSAFHNLFPFRKSLSVSLPEAALRQVNLRLFSEHRKKKENQLDYQDRELVEVLIQFTRARDRRASLRFWQQNLEVMDNAIELFHRTNEFLKTIFLATGRPS